MSVSYWQDPESSRPAERVPSVIVGAGLIGAYLAWRLAQEDEQPVVVEARHVAGGASGRNAGMVLTGVADNYARAVAHYGRQEAQTLHEITVRNRALMWELCQRFRAPATRTGSLILAVDREEAEELEAASALLREDGFAAEYQPGDPLGRGFLAALSNPNDFVIDPLQLVQNMLLASGARVYEGREVYALESQDDGVLVRARGLSLLAQRVFLATNAYTGLLEPAFSTAVIPQRAQVLITGPGTPLLGPACYSNRGFDYFRQLPDGRLLMGGCRNRCFREERTFADGTTPRIQGALEELLRRYFPDLQAPVERRWSGTMGFTADGLPLVGRLRRDERIGFAVGFNGHGLGLGVLAAEGLLNTLHGGSSLASQLFSARRLLKEAL